jgi:hypothetical protein
MRGFVCCWSLSSGTESGSYPVSFASPPPPDSRCTSGTMSCAAGHSLVSGCASSRQVSCMLLLWLLRHRCVVAHDFVCSVCVDSV